MIQKAKISPGAKNRKNADLIDLETLAAEQGVKPVENPRDLKGDFWPENEDLDEFLGWLRKTRCEGR